MTLSLPFTDPARGSRGSVRSGSLRSQSRRTRRPRVLAQENQCDGDSGDGPNRGRANLRHHIGQHLHRDFLGRSIDGGQLTIIRVIQIETRAERRRPVTYYLAPKIREFSDPPHHSPRRSRSEPTTVAATPRLTPGAGLILALLQLCASSSANWSWLECGG